MKTTRVREGVKGLCGGRGVGAEISEVISVVSAGNVCYESFLGVVIIFEGGWTLWNNKGSGTGRGEAGATLSPQNCSGLSQRDKKLLDR